MRNYALLLLLPGLLLTACSQSSNRAEMVADETATISEPMTTETATTAAIAEPDVPLARLWRATGHPVIYKGSLELEVTDFDAASSRLDTLLSQHGAYLTDANETTDAGRHQQVLTIRVPSERFLALTSRLGRLGQVQSKQISSRDIAAELARLRTTTTTTRDTAIARNAAAESRLLTEQATMGTLELTYFQFRSATDTAPAAAVGPRLVAGLWFGWRIVGLLFVGLAYGWPLLLALAGWAWWRWRQGAFASGPRS